MANKFSPSQRFRMVPREGLIKKSSNHLPLNLNNTKKAKPQASSLDGWGMG